MGTKANLNNQCPGNKAAALGDKLDALITLVNELKVVVNAHITEGTHAVATTVDAEAALVEAASVPALT